MMDGTWSLFRVATFLPGIFLFATSAVHAHDGDDGDPCDPIGPFGVPGLALPTDQIGMWEPPINWPTQSTHTSPLPSGKVIWWRGNDQLVNQTRTYIWEPVSGSLTPSLALSEDLFCAGHATLSDGRLISIGGTVDDTNANGGLGTNIFDPATEQWTNHADMNFGRWYPTATTLSDGRILALGGTTTPAGSGLPAVNADMAEVYNPVTNIWDVLDAEPRVLNLYPQTYLIPDGRVYTIKARRYLDINAEQWIVGPPQVYGASQYSSAMYAPGKIIKMGGRNPAIDKAEVIDFNDASPTWREVDSMEYPRRRHDATLLADGSVLAVGGSTATQEASECAVHAAERWDPVTELWTTMASTIYSRIYHSTCVLLEDARVLCAGGEDDHDLGQSNVEIFNPPYLFKGPQPTINSAPTTTIYGATIQVTTTDTSAISSIALVRPSAVTHNFDQNQRYVPLNFSDQGTHLDVSAPANGNLAPPGKYMLFIIDNNGVPSIAEWIQLGHPDTDLDGIVDPLDNCPAIANANQTDTDNDGAGDACDSDDDNDGLSDTLEGSIGTNPLLADSDGDNLTDFFEVGYDGDANTYTPGSDLNPLAVDTDGDGFNDDVEVTAGTDPLNNQEFPGSSADGDINNDGNVDTADVLLAYRIALGLLVPDAGQLSRGDVAPLVAGVPAPDGVIDTSDALLILRKAMGQLSF